MVGFQVSGQEAAGEERGLRWRTAEMEQEKGSSQDGKMKDGIIWKSQKLVSGETPQATTVRKSAFLFWD